MPQRIYGTFEPSLNVAAGGKKPRCPTLFEISWSYGARVLIARDLNATCAQDIGAA